MVHKHVIKALESVSSTSGTAKEIAQQLLTESQAELIKQLQDKIKSMESTIVHLMSEDPDDLFELSDESASVLSAQFKVSLKDVDAHGLLRYGLDYLCKYPKYMRTTLATVLNNKANELGVPPLDAWLDVVALDGRIK